MPSRLSRATLAVLSALVLAMLPGLAAADPGNGNRSKTQGKSESNPDGGGVDKPYGADGQPAKSQGPAYFDGNNGCGQDKKSGEPRETGTRHTGWDDNNGWCGKRPIRGQGGGNGGGGGNVGGGAGVGGTNIGGSGGSVGGSGGSLVGGSGGALVGGAGFTNTPSTPTLVLGVTFTRALTPNSTAVLGTHFERGQTLATTGIEVRMILLLGFAMLGLGTLMVSARPRATKS